MISKSENLSSSGEASLDLGSEVEYLYHLLFKRAPSNSIIENYLRIHEEFLDLRSADPQELRTVHLVVAKKLDATGIEPWLRCGQKRHLLSAKLLLLNYLAECAGNCPEFERRTSGRFFALFRLILSGSVAVLRMLRGGIQRARYDLV